MLASFCLALALTPAPRVAVVVVDGPETARVELRDALAADPAVSAQPQSLIDQLLANAASMGLVCALDDAHCWTKIGLDGELDLLVVASAVAGGAFELRLVDIGAGHEVSRVVVAPGAQLGARAALARLLHPPPPLDLPPPTERAPHPPPPPKPAAAPRPDAEQPGPASVSSMLMIVAGGAAVVGVACGIAAANVDLSLTEMLVAAKDTGVLLDRPSYDEQENTQNLLIACGAVAGATAIASAAGALVVE